VWFPSISLNRNGQAIALTGELLDEGVKRAKPTLPGVLEQAGETGRGGQAGIAAGTATATLTGSLPHHEIR